MTLLLFAFGLTTVGFIALVIRRKQKNPRTSYLMGVLNVGMTPLRWLNLGPFKDGTRPNLMNSMDAAVKMTGLSDFGDLGFMEGK